MSAAARGGVYAAAGAAIVALLAGAAWRSLGRRAPLAAPSLSVVEALGSAPDDERFARADAPRVLRFPEDHGPHPEFRNEWWYWTGNLESEGGRRWGFQLTFFRSAYAPERDAGRASAWAARDVYMAHFSVTDAARASFRAFERTSRDALDLAGATGDPFGVHVLDWSARGPAAPGAATPLHLHAGSEGVDLDLDLEQGKPPALHGAHGLSQKGGAPGNASFYVSLTRMPARGFIEAGGERVAVRGEAWMDHEWSTRALEPGQIGWDWFSLQLDDGRELMFFRLRRVDGAVDPHSSGSLVEPDGAVRALGREEVVVEPVGEWQSPRTGARYPASFRLRVPSVDLDLAIAPLLADQELSLSFRYWEGAVRAEGTAQGARVAGRGYAELTGYQGPAR